MDAGEIYDHLSRYGIELSDKTWNRIVITSEEINANRAENKKRYLARKIFRETFVDEQDEVVEAIERDLDERAKEKAEDAYDRAMSIL